MKTIAIEKAAAEMVRAAEKATAEESKGILLAQHESVVKATATEKAAAEKVRAAEKSYNFKQRSMRWKRS